MAADLGELAPEPDDQGALGVPGPEVPGVMVDIRQFSSATAPTGRGGGHNIQRRYPVDQATLERMKQHAGTAATSGTEGEEIR